MDIQERATIDLLRLYNIKIHIEEYIQIIHGLQMKIIRIHTIINYLMVWVDKIILCGLYLIKQNINL